MVFDTDEGVGIHMPAIRDIEVSIHTDGATDSALIEMVISAFSLLSFAASE